MSACDHTNQSKTLVSAVTQEALERANNNFSVREFRLISQINRPISSNLILNLSNPLISLQHKYTHPLMIPSIANDVNIPCHHVDLTATTILSEFPFDLP